MPPSPRLKIRSNLCLPVLLCALSISTASALELDLTPYLQAGSGQATGTLLAGRGDFYAELGASSYSTPGSSAPYYPILLGGLGVDLTLSRGALFLWKEPFSFVAGLDVGAWGGAISGSTVAGTAFASTSARSIAVSFSAAERWSLRFGNGILSAELGPFVGFTTGYLIQEYISGVTTTGWVSPELVDLAFVGAGLGVNYSFRLGKGSLRLGLLGDIGITPLASEYGATGATIVYPWRALARVGYELPLSIRKVKK